MKIRNLPFNELNEVEQALVESWYPVCINGGGCRHRNCEKDIQTFWGNHRTADTENGTYEGWHFEDKLTNLLANKIQNEDNQ